MNKSVFSSQHVKHHNILDCPFCGNEPAVSDFAIPMVVWCETDKCPLGPNRLVQGNLGKASFDPKHFTIPMWNTRIVRVKTQDEPETPAHWHNQETHKAPTF